MRTIGIGIILLLLLGLAGFTGYLTFRHMQHDEKIGNQIEASDLRGFDAVRTDDHYTLTFGQYRQGEHGEIMPIEWRVLAVKGGSALVISEKLLNYAPYNEVLTDVTWETCSLRQWLNDTFYKTAFSAEEQDRIAEVTLFNPGNSDNHIDGGHNTKDKVFVLCLDEAVKYFPNNKARMAYITPFAYKHHLQEYGLPISHWWLRSPGWDGFSASYVRNTLIDRNGKKVNSTEVGVRPAMWLKRG